MDTDKDTSDLQNFKECWLLFCLINIFTWFKIGITEIDVHWEVSHPPLSPANPFHLVSNT